MTPGLLWHTLFQLHLQHLQAKHSTTKGAVGQSKETSGDRKTASAMALFYKCLSPKGVLDPAHEAAFSTMHSRVT